MNEFWSCFTDGIAAANLVTLQHVWTSPREGGFISSNSMLIFAWKIYDMTKKKKKKSPKNQWSMRQCYPMLLHLDLYQTTQEQNLLPAAVFLTL